MTKIKFTHKSNSLYSFFATSYAEFREITDFMYKNFKDDVTYLYDEDEFFYTFMTGKIEESSLFMKFINKKISLESFFISCKKLTLPA